MRLINADELRDRLQNLTGTIPCSTIVEGTISASAIGGTINTPIKTPTSEKKVYRCAYCGTLHEHNTGTCDRCGASMGEAVEVAVDPEPVINGTIETREDDFCLYGEGRCRDCKYWQNQQHLCTLWSKNG